MTPRVYVAAPYALSPFVRDVHVQLEDIGCHPVSRYAEIQTEAECLTDEKARAQRAMWEINVESVDHCDVMLVIGADQGGGEMFAEVGRALGLGKPVLWCGRRRILSCYAPGVVLCHTMHGDPRMMYDGLDVALDELSKAAKLGGDAKSIRETLLRPRVTVGPVKLHAITGGQS